MSSAANYLATGKWSQCYHCKILFAGEHYCGAPWQTPPIGPFPDGVDAAWIDAVKTRTMPVEKCGCGAPKAQSHLCAYWPPSQTGDSR